MSQHGKQNLKKNLKTTKNHKKKYDTLILFDTARAVKKYLGQL